MKPPKKDDKGRYGPRRWIVVATISQAADEVGFTLLAETDEMMHWEIREHFRSMAHEFDEDERDEIIKAINDPNGNVLLEHMAKVHGYRIAYDHRTMLCEPPTVEEQLDEAHHADDGRAEG